MSIYTDSIVKAFATFPFVALFFTVPYMIFCYRKYGSFLAYRVLVVYSFILYMMCAYFLVILPLPDPDFVASLTGPRAQLIPFMFVSDIIKEAKDAPIYANRAVIQVLFNILLTVPFGFYLRYYFKLDIKKTVLYSFILSLFYELTQLSGLYFIYERGYRLFDVDDLMLNTLGGCIGYYLVSPFKKILPAREKIDELSLAKSEQISWIRRCLVLFVDMTAITTLFTLITSLIKYFEKEPTVPYNLVCLLYLIVVVILFKHSSLGMKAAGLKVVTTDENSLSIFRIVLRYVCFGFIYFYGPQLLLKSFAYLYDYELITKDMHYVLMLIIAFIWFGIYLSSFIKMFKHKILLFEALSKTKLESVVKRKG